MNLLDLINGITEMSEYFTYKVIIEVIILCITNNDISIYDQIFFVSDLKSLNYIILLSFVFKFILIVRVNSFNVMEKAQTKYFISTSIQNLDHVQILKFIYYTIERFCALNIYTPTEQQDLAQIRMFIFVKGDI